MVLPSEPFECDVCKQKKMRFKKTLGKTEKDKMVIISLSILVENETKYIYPLTAICDNCTQIKFFMLNDEIANKTA